MTPFLRSRDNPRWNWSRIFLVRNRWIGWLAVLLVQSWSVLATAAFQVERVEGTDVGIVATQPDSGPFVKTDRGFMVAYTAKIPGTEIEFTMVPIPGGTFRMGSPENDPDRQADEGPQFEVTVEPFWIGRCEVTWAEYRRYMELHDWFKEFEQAKIRVVEDEGGIDVITAPSKLYDPSFTFSAGDEVRGPAASMTQYAAKQYTKWLSTIRGEFYRLPTEAEWEYAARAGSTTRYAFGEDMAELAQYAWTLENSEGKRHEVGQKLPNAWGLHDMHGNVAEWVLDQYSPDGYAAYAGQPQTVATAFAKPTKVYPRVARGGSFELPAAAARSAARLASNDRTWKEEDPNFPKSPWWYTSSPAVGVGFRLLRPLDAPNREGQETYWRPDIDSILEDAMSRVRDEGRGAIGLVDPELPQAIDARKKK